MQALSNDLADAVAKAGESVVAVHARQRVPSSGIVWGQGVIVSADHTIKRDEDITVSTPEGESIPAVLAGRDRATDLAVLKVEGNDLAASEVASASALRIGDLVLALGCAGRLSANLGVVSALDGAWRTWRGGQIDRFIRPDVSIYYGFSGGALVDAAGRLIGMNTSGLWRNSPLTIPAATIGRVAKELLEKGRVARGYLGVGMQPIRLPEALRKKLGGKTGAMGLIMVTVEPASPAEESGVLLGDVLVALEGEPVSDADDLQAKLGSGSVGRHLHALVLRAGVPTEITLTVGERSRQPQPGESR